MADIKINAKQWGSIDENEQKEISQILRETGLLESDDRIVADRETKAIDLKETAGATSISACTTLCNTAQSAAEILCKRLPWPADKVCIYAAQKAGDFCRSKC